MTQYGNVDLLLIPQVMKNFEVSNMNAPNAVSVELEVLKGMPGEKDSTLESAPQLTLLFGYSLDRYLVLVIS